MNQFKTVTLYSVMCCLFLNCASFLLETEIADEEIYTYSGILHYELYGWLGEGNSRHANAILRRFHKMKLAKQLRSLPGIQSITESQEFLVQIIYEDSASMGILLDQPEHPLSHRVEKKPEELGLYILNRIVSYNTFLIVPVFKRNQERIVFRTWHRNKLQQESFCTLDHLHVFGWIPLFLKPWDDSEEIHSRYADCGMVFAKSWKHIHLNNKD